jgi:hypothetical protein
MDRQDAKDARGLEEPAGEVDAVASSVGLFATPPL